MSVILCDDPADVEVVDRLRRDLVELGGLDEMVGAIRYRPTLFGLACWPPFGGSYSALVFALSDSSWWSEMCRGDLDRAERIDLPVVYVRVGPLGAVPARLLRGWKVIDYTAGRGRTELGAELADHPVRPIGRSDTLPARSDLPLRYLRRLSQALGEEPIAREDQEQLVELFRDERMSSLAGISRAEVRHIVGELQDRPELTFRTTRELDEILRGLSGAAPAGPGRSGGVFVSYRRAGTGHIAGRIADRLIDRFGEDRVFMDVDSIEPGLDFRAVIADAIGRCEVLLAVIDAGWPTSRLGESDDLVRIEIETALRRGIRVIPVLVDDAEMPGAPELPASLADLTRRHAVKVRHDTFRGDVTRLLDALARGGDGA